MSTRGVAGPTGRARPLAGASADADARVPDGADMLERVWCAMSGKSRTAATRALAERVIASTDALLDQHTAAVQSAAAADPPRSPPHLFLHPSAVAARVARTLGRRMTRLEREATRLVFDVHTHVLAGLGLCQV